jgi:hypothetical protein
MPLLGVLAGIAVGTIPSLAQLETGVGLYWLFNLSRRARGVSSVVGATSVAHSTASCD